MVALSAVRDGILEAFQISVVLTNNAKNIEISNEMQNRLNKLYVNTYLTVGSKLSVMFYGKKLIFEVKSINSTEKELKTDYLTKLEEGIANLSTNVSQAFYKVTEKSFWNLFR